MTTWRMPAVGRLGEERVDIAGARGQQVGHALHAPRRTGVVDVGGVEFTGGPSGEEVDADGAHQRLGERSSISAALVARARPAATMVAVAPTLVARSQVSFSVRPTGGPFSLRQINEPRRVS